MSQRNTLVRSMHDLGLAAWFGGSLMGAVGLNGGASQAKEPSERLRVSSAGWARWAPVSAAAIGVHAIGGIGLIAGNKNRLSNQDEAQSNTVVKTALTVLAAGLTAWSGRLGATVAKHADNPATSVTQPSPAANDELANAQKQLAVCQWAIPAVTGVLIVLGAQQGEQQRPLQRLGGLAKR